MEWAGHVILETDALAVIYQRVVEKGMFDLAPTGGLICELQTTYC
jgi:hypothetical protein